MKSEHKILYQPFKIGDLTIKNRFIMAPMGNGGMVSTENAFKENAVDYFVERAKGGVGLIITGTVYAENTVEKKKNGVMPCPIYNTGEFMQTAAVMAERIHAYNSKIFLQLTAGFGRVLKPHILAGEGVSASKIKSFWDENVECRELTKEEIEYIVEKTAESALIARKAGFDGIEIHAVHEGYLLDQFAIKLFNNRTDEYGGDLRGRLKFACDIVKRIKQVAGEDYPVILRYSIKSCIKGIHQGGLPGEEYEELGRDLDEGIEAAKILEEAGYDGFDLDLGTYDSWYWSHPPMYFEKGMYIEYSDILKKAVKVPVMISGRMEDPDLASQTISCGKTDAIVIGRGLLADPHIPNKILFGNAEDIRPCLSCHNGCMGRLITAKPISCAVNPQCGREKTYGINPMIKKKKVMIVGGGVAGMEVARISAIRGHDVTLFEKSDKLGGALISGGAPKFKEDDRNLIKWYENQLKRLDVTIHMNSPVKKEKLDGYEGDVIVIATGSSPKRIKFAGEENTEIIEAKDALVNGEKLGQKVLIIGGGLVGCELALHLKTMGKNVSVLEKMDSILSAGSNIQHMNREMLIDLLNHKGVNIYDDTSILNIGKNQVSIERKGESKELEYDSIVSSIGYYSERSLYEEIDKSGKEIYIVGDSRQVKNIMYAVWDGYEVGNNI